MRQGDGTIDLLTVGDTTYTGDERINVSYKYVYQFYLQRKIGAWKKEKEQTGKENENKLGKRNE